MGTNAVLKFRGINDRIIGMMLDGSPQNLNYLSSLAFTIAREKRILTLFRGGNSEALNKVFDALIEKHCDWLFADSPRNPEWVSYFAILDPKTAIVTHHEEYPANGPGHDYKLSQFR